MAALKQWKRLQIKKTLKNKTNHWIIFLTNRRKYQTNISDHQNDNNPMNTFVDPCPVLFICFYDSQLMSLGMKQNV